MDAVQLIDRRRLRRKLSFWRAAAIIVGLAVIGVAIYAAAPDGRGGDHIARIEINGMITDDSKLVDLIEHAQEADNVKAIVVSVSTPGGTTYGGEQLRKALVEARQTKPVVADVRTLAASAGYMIAASTDHIVAGETSIVGSIGVIFQYPQVGELMDKIGVQMNEIKSSPLKAEPSPFHPATPEAEEMIRSMVLDSYDWFVDLVAEERDRGSRTDLSTRSAARPRSAPTSRNAASTTGSKWSSGSRGARTAAAGFRPWSARQFSRLRARPFRSPTRFARSAAESCSLTVWCRFGRLEEIRP